MCACIYVSPPEYMCAWFLYIYIYLHIWLITYVYLHTLRAYNMCKYIYITAPEYLCAWFVQQRTAAGPLSACSLICQSLYTYEYTYMTAPITYTCHMWHPCDIHIHGHDSPPTHQCTNLLLLHTTAYTCIPICMCEYARSAPVDVRFSRWVPIYVSLGGCLYVSVGGCLYMWTKILPFTKSCTHTHTHMRMQA